MRKQMKKGMPSRASRRVALRAQGPDEGGFTLVEVLVAVVILMIVVISFSYLLVDSLSTALLSKQREAAASLASDVVENARALGLTALTTPVTGSCSTGSATSPLSTPAIESAACFQSGFKAYVKIDTTTYTINTSLTGSAPVNVIVSVNWNQASNSFSYTSTGQVGV